MARNGSLDIRTAGLLSLAAHGTAAFAVVLAVHVLWLLRVPKVAEHTQVAPKTAPASNPTEIEIELPDIAPSSPLLGQAPVAAEDVPDVLRGGSTVARLDQRDPGKGGDDRSPDRALNLADQNDKISLDPSVFSSLSESQLARIEAKNKMRQSYENQRSSREPMELTFVAMGKAGKASERRPEAAINPARGSRTFARRSTVGGPRGGDAAPTGEGERPRVAGAADEGSKARQAGAGDRNGNVSGPTSYALENAHARPLVNTSDPSIPSTEEGKPSDTVDSEQAVTARMQALMHASTMGGATKADGRGGEGGGGTPGAGGTSGAGQSAGAVGSGGKGPGDIAREGYVRTVAAKIHPYWANAFPKWAIAEGRSGTATVSFTILADGSVTNVRVTRSSGIDEFDNNVAAAVKRAGPFGKLPEVLGTSLNISIPFAANNPAVRPRNPKDGM